MLYKNKNEKEKEIQLLRRLMRYCVNEEKAERNAKMLMSEFGCIKNILNAEISEFYTKTDIPESAAVSLCLFGKLIKYTEYERFGENPVLTDSDVRVKFARAVVSVMPYEDFYMLMLDEKGRLIKNMPVSRGGEHSVNVNKRLVADAALRCGAKGVIVVHTHPGTSALPSNDDIKSSIGMMLNELGIKLVDHIIVSREDGCSMNRLGII